jgi:hypothetical protein
MDSIQSTISSWRDFFFIKPILNRIWHIFPGFLLWEIWEERNRRIFKDESKSWEIIGIKIKKDIFKTISKENWSPDDLPFPLEIIPFYIIGFLLLSSMTLSLCSLFQTPLSLLLVSPPPWDLSN